MILGEFVPGYAEALGPLLEHPSVEVRGFASDPAAVMREADVLVLPSVEEGSALVTYEAQLCGCVPVVWTPRERGASTGARASSTRPATSSS